MTDEADNEAEPESLEERQAKIRLLSEALRTNRWIPHWDSVRNEPRIISPKQFEFLCLPDKEALFGGSGYSGKSDTLLMGGMQFADIPGYHAMLFRRTYAQLTKPGAIMDRAGEWLAPTAANWNESKKQWRFPSGAVLGFSHMQYEKDREDHQGATYHFVGFDELCQFMKTMYTYLRGWIRRMEGSPIPGRLRGATNPGGIGHQWVYERFAIDGRPGLPFVRARYTDNPVTDKADYLDSLEGMDEILVRQIRDGSWVLDPSGKKFKIEWWAGDRCRYDIETHYWRNACLARWQSWDTAEKKGETNAYTVCTTFEMDTRYQVAVSNVKKERVNAVDVPDFIREHAYAENADHKLEKGGVIIEDQSSGTVAIQALTTGRDWLSQAVRPFRPAHYGSKDERAQRAAVWCGRDCVVLPYPCEAVPWLWDCEQDLEMCPDLTYWDFIDSFSQGVLYLEPHLAEGWRARTAKGGKVATG